MGIEEVEKKMLAQARLRIQSYLDRGESPADIRRAIGAWSRLSSRSTQREEFPNEADIPSEA